MAQSDHKTSIRSEGSHRKDRDRPTRPKGAVIWAHATRAEHEQPLHQLLERLKQQRPDCTLVLSRPDDLTRDQMPEIPNVQVVKQPEDNTTSLDAFLEFWQPDFVLWTSGNLRAAVVDRLTRRNIPIGLVAAETDLISTPTWRWFKAFSRSTLSKLEFLFTLDTPSLRDVEHLKLDSVDVAMGGPFVESAISLPYRETDRAELAGLLLGRPIWLAAHLDPRELSVVLDAHRQVVRYSHRALLIVAPHEMADVEAFASEFKQSTLRSVNWSDGETPEEATQIVFADIPGELGLWYRLAPISFMGRSLFLGMPGSDPNEPAAHGSAVLHGPHLGNRAASYTRFSEASAAQRVTDADSLAQAVTRLIQPDKCATMAHTAWEVASRGSALIDTIADRILDKLDQSRQRQ